MRRNRLEQIAVFVSLAATSFTPFPAAASKDALQQGATQVTVKIHVLVTDATNQPVRNLTQSSFQLLENGKNQVISYFSEGELPIRYGVLVDNTGSIRAQFEESREAVRTVIGNHRPNDAGFMVSMSDGDAMALIKWTSDKAALQHALESLKRPAGTTDLIDAGYKCADLFAELEVAPHRRALIIISDGVDNDSAHRVSDLAKRLNKNDVQVFAIGLVQKLDEQSGRFGLSQRQRAVTLFETLAKETGGRAFFPKSPSELRLNATEIMNLLRSEYVLGYVPTKPLDKDSFREISVKVISEGGKKHQVSARHHVGLPERW